MRPWQERAAENVAANEWLPHRKPNRHGDGPWDAVTAEYLVEGRYAEAEHPRNRLGKWIDVLGDNLAQQGYEMRVAKQDKPFFGVGTRGNLKKHKVPGDYKVVNLFHEGKLVGSASASGPYKYDPNGLNVPAYHLQAVYVDPAHRGQGHATRLVNALSEHVGYPMYSQKQVSAEGKAFWEANTDRDGLWEPKTTVLGTTPFLTDKKEAAGRSYPDLVPGQPIKDFAHAAALHSDEHWEPLFKAFEQDAEKLAAKHNVEIVRGERNVGVFEGSYEPSYAITVSGPKANIDAYNKALGQKYRQKAVVGFTADPKGRDAELRFSGGKDPAAFFEDLKSVMGDDAGASFDADEWRVFVYDGAGTGHETTSKLVALAKKRGMEVRVARGHGDYHELRKGAG